MAQRFLDIRFLDLRRLADLDNAWLPRRHHEMFRNCHSEENRMCEIPSWVAFHAVRVSSISDDTRAREWPCLTSLIEESLLATSAW